MARFQKIIQSHLNRYLRNFESFEPVIDIKVMEEEENSDNISQSDVHSDDTPISSLSDINVRVLYTSILMKSAD